MNGPAATNRWFVCSVLALAIVSSAAMSVAPVPESRHRYRLTYTIWSPRFDDPQGPYVNCRNASYGYVDAPCGFGPAFALCGDTLVVGITLGGGSYYRGGIMIYEFDGATWNNTATFAPHPDDPEFDDFFAHDRQGILAGKVWQGLFAGGDILGRPIVCTENSIAVSELNDNRAPVVAGGIPQFNQARGAVFFYEKHDGVWRFVQRVRGGKGEGFGFDLTGFDGESLVVSAPWKGRKRSGVGAGGAIYSLAKIDGRWRRVATIKAKKMQHSDRDIVDLYGPVARQGDLLAATADWSNSFGVAMFRRTLDDGGRESWTLESLLAADDPNASIDAVSFDGDLVAFGSAGSVATYRNVRGEWVDQGIVHLEYPPGVSFNGFHPGVPMLGQGLLVVPLPDLGERSVVGLYQYRRKGWKRMPDLTLGPDCCPWEPASNLAVDGERIAISDEYSQPANKLAWPDSGSIRIFE